MKVLKRFVVRLRVGLALLAALACLAGVGLGAYRLLLYSLPMYQQAFTDAASMEAGEKGVALYDAALKEFKAKNYAAAQKLLVESYSDMTSEKEAKRVIDDEMAARVQFLLGVVSEKTKQTQPAIEAYRLALRHNPNHMEAKYNLERLTASGGDSGGAGAKPGEKPGSGQGSQGKKGI